MRHRLFVHVVWTTRDRAPLINLEAAQYLASVIPYIARDERCVTLELGIVTTHLHALFQIHPTTALPRLLQRLKGCTATRVNQQRLTTTSLLWSKGYNIESVSSRALDAVAGKLVHLHPHW